MTAEALLKMLREGGHIKSSNDCSAFEIALARACHRFYVDEDGFGYVYTYIPPKYIVTSEEVWPMSGSV
jgi:hypothetical protein